MLRAARTSCGTRSRTPVRLFTDSVERSSCAPATARRRARSISGDRSASAPGGRASAEADCCVGTVGGGRGEDAGDEGDGQEDGDRRKAGPEPLVGAGVPGGPAPRWRVGRPRTARPRRRGRPARAAVEGRVVAVAATRRRGLVGRRGRARCRGDRARPSSRRPRSGGGRCAGPRRRRRARTAAAATPASASWAISTVSPSLVSSRAATSALDERGVLVVRRPRCGGPGRGPVRRRRPATPGAA